MKKLFMCKLTELLWKSSTFKSIVWERFYMDSVLPLKNNISILKARINQLETEIHLLKDSPITNETVPVVKKTKKSKKTKNEKSNSVA